MSFGHGVIAKGSDPRQDCAWAAHWTNDTVKTFKVFKPFWLLKASIMDKTSIFNLQLQASRICFQIYFLYIFWTIWFLHNFTIAFLDSFCAVKFRGRCLGWPSSRRAVCGEDLHRGVGWLGQGAACHVVCRFGGKPNKLNDWEKDWVKGRKMAGIWWF